VTVAAMARVTNGVVLLGAGQALLAAVGARGITTKVERAACALRAQGRGRSVRKTRLITKGMHAVCRLI
jgi:hypothetical protein